MMALERWRHAGCGWHGRCSSWFMGDGRRTVGSREIVASGMEGMKAGCDMDDGCQMVGARNWRLASS